MRKPMNYRYPFLRLCFALVLSFFALKAIAQTTIYRPILTAMPSLRIAADARSAALGEQGVATSADVYSQYWNASKYAFADSYSGIALSYTPWLRGLVNDISLTQVSGYYQLDKGAKHTLGSSLRYFSIGELTQWNELGQSLGALRPNELSFDVSYAYRWHQHYALGATLRYLRADHSLQGSSSAASALVFELSAYMQKPAQLLGYNFVWRAGLSLRNIGSKLSLDGGSRYEYLPTTLALGSGLTYKFDAEHQLGLSVEASKLLVPIYPNADMYPVVAELTEAREHYYARNAWSAMLYSFGDAPGGFSEEFKEIRWSLGAEYTYRDMLFLRAGYAYQSPDKGNLQGLTAGAGIRWRALTFDVSYLMSTVAHNPQDGTFRCSLSLDLAKFPLLFR